MKTLTLDLNMLNDEQLQWYLELNKLSSDKKSESKSKKEKDSDKPKKDLGLTKDDVVYVNKKENKIPSFPSPDKQQPTERLQPPEYIPKFD